MLASLRLSLVRALTVGAILAFACVVAMLPTVLALITGQAKTGYMLYEVWLPEWAQWQVLTRLGFGVVVMGALGGLLLTVGRWPIRLVALACVGGAMYLRAIFVGSSYWISWMANRGELTPFTVATSINAVLFAIAAVLALLEARRLRLESAAEQSV